VSQAASALSTRARRAKSRMGGRQRPGNREEGNVTLSRCEFVALPCGRRPAAPRPSDVRMVSAATARWWTAACARRCAAPADWRSQREQTVDLSSGSAALALCRGCWRTASGESDWGTTRRPAMFSRGSPRGRLPYGCRRAAGATDVGLGIQRLQSLSPWPQTEAGAAADAAPRRREPIAGADGRARRPALLAVGPRA